MTVLPASNNTKTSSKSRRRTRRGKRQHNLRNTKLNNNNRMEIDNSDRYDDIHDENELTDIEMATPRSVIDGECTLPSPAISLSSNSASSNFNFPDNNMELDIAREREEERRTFHFNIENDENLRHIINTNGDTISLFTGETSSSNIDMNNVMINGENISDLTSDYILSKLYNYMKISEMSKYGISVFEMTFSSYLPYLYESDLIKLASSYWCNGQHFSCMISHRGNNIKSNTNTKLKLKLSEDLLDTAMQSGASVDKVEAMLLQKRKDDAVFIHHNYKSNNNRFYHTQNERNFYLRNLKHRFWNHEVLVRVFIKNGWLTKNLANVAIKAFIKTVYYRTLQSKYSFINKQKNRNQIKFSENFLHSFFVSYFCLDDIPKMYKKEIFHKINSKNKETNECYLYLNQISEETLRRWCELVELLASRGANVNEYEFRKIIPLQYALNLGKNTYKIISYSHKMRNELLIPQIYHQQNIYIPDDVWNILLSYL